MQKKHKIILGIVVGIAVFAIIGFFVAKWTGLIDILASAFGPSYIYDLRDGNSLTGPETCRYLQKRNSKFAPEDCDFFASKCKELGVNQAFAMGIAGADSAFATAGVGRTADNPGNTMAGNLEKYGIVDTGRVGNFARFKNLGHGMAAICGTLKNGHYSLDGSLDAILKIYAGDPNSNYYGTVRRVMSDNLSTITISGKLYDPNSQNQQIMGQARVALFQGGIPIKEVQTPGAFSFGALPRANDYAISVANDYYLNEKIDVVLPHADNYFEIALKRNLSLAGLPKNTAETTYIEGQVNRLLLDPMVSETLTLKATNLETGSASYAMTDSNGHFTFSGLLPGNYRIDFYSVQKDITAFNDFKDVSAAVGKPVTDITFVL